MFWRYDTSIEEDMFIMRKNIFIILLLLILMPCVKVNADTYFVNQNGVSLTEKEYEFISNFYFDGYQNYMTLKDYNDFIDSNVMKGEIKITEYDDSKNLIAPYSTSSHETASKILKLSSSCLDNCTISLSLTWKKIPTTKSYDLIGAYMENTSLVSLKQSKMYYGSNSVSSVENNIKYNGLSSTFKIPNTSEAISFLQVYTVEKRGKVYASYQHAKNSVSLAESRRYSFGKSGYGNVFVFDSAIASRYDGMQGLNVAL